MYCALQYCLAFFPTYTILMTFDTTFVYKIGQISCNGICMDLRLQNDRSKRIINFDKLGSLRQDVKAHNTRIFEDSAYRTRLTGHSDIIGEYTECPRGECARLPENVPYVKVHRYNPKHLYPKLNGYGDNGERSLKV